MADDSSFKLPTTAGADPDKEEIKEDNNNNNNNNMNRDKEPSLFFFTHHRGGTGTTHKTRNNGTNSNGNGSTELDNDDEEEAKDACSTFSKPHQTTRPFSLRYSVFLALVVVVVLGGTIAGVILGAASLSKEEDDDNDDELSSISGTSSSSSSSSATLEPTLACTGTQLGSDLYGQQEDVDSSFGFSVSFSSSGNRVALGDPAIGQVSIWDWSLEDDDDDGGSGSWVRQVIGSDLLDGNDSQSFGYSVSLSSDGNRLAVGAPLGSGEAGHVQVFDWTVSSESGEALWVQVGVTVVGDQSAVSFGSSCPADSFGRSVSLSSNGRRLAVGAPGSDLAVDGYVQIFHWLVDDAVWVSMGAPLEGVNRFDNLGWSVSLSDDGNRVAVGAVGHGDGLVHIFDWSGIAWMQVGSALDNSQGPPGGMFGDRVSLSSDGNRIAVLGDYRGGSSGLVRIYDWSGSAWTQMESDLDGNATSDDVMLLGDSISLSSDGNRLAVGTLAKDDNGMNTGHLRILDWSGIAWEPLGSELIGQASLDQFGFSVSLSSDGTRVAVGAAGVYSSAGYVRIFGLEDASCQAL